MARSGISGTKSLRRKLRGVEPRILREATDVIRDGLNRIQRDAMALVPVDQGDLQASIDVKLSRDRLAGIVGPGVKAADIVRRRTGSAFGSVVRRGKKRGQKIRLIGRNRQALWQFYKGYWVEFGTKGAPRRNIPPQPARPFMRPAYDRNRAWIRMRWKRAVTNVLERVSRGG